MRLGLAAGLTGRRGGPSAAYTINIGSGPFTTGTELTATVSGLAGGETVTYQWTDDATNITGATSAAYTAAIGTDAVADASLIGPTVTIDGTEYVARGREIRYPPGSVTETGAPFAWTIDDTTLNQNFASDFTTTNLTGSYVIAGLPTGGVDDEDGTASGTLTGTPSSGNVTVTFTDQYGRPTVGTYAFTAAYRTQATAAGALADQIEAINSGNQTFDASTDFTANGNTLTYSVNSVSGVSINSSTGVLTFATDSMAAQATSIVVTATDEYLRPTPTGFSLTIATVPEAATVAMFSLADNADATAELTISSLPGNGGQPSGFTAQYQVNGGTWRAVPSYAGTGDYTLTTDITAGTLSIALRWVNDVGNGTASATEDVTVTGASATITIDTLTYTRGTAGIAPDVSTTTSSTGTPVGDFTLFYATHPGSTTLTKTNIENGTGDALETGTIVASTLAGLDDSAIDLDVSVTAGELSAFIRDANGIESDVVEETGVTYDSVAPAFSGAATNTGGTSVTATLTKDAYASSTDFVVNINDSPATIDEVASPGGTTEVAIALTDTIANGDTVTVAYTGMGLVGIDAEVVPTFTAQSVMNNVPAASTFGVTVLPVVTENGFVSSGADLTVSLDVSAYGSGDIVGVVYGPVQDTSAATLDGGAMTDVGATGGSAHGRMRLFTRTLTGAGGSASNLVITLSTGTNEHIVSAFVVEGGQIATTTFTSSTNGATLSEDATPTKANNVILGFTQGNTAGFGSNVAWTNLTEQREVASLVRNSGEGYARADDVAVATLSVQSNATGSSNDRGLVVIAIEEAD